MSAVVRSVLPVIRVMTEADLDDVLVIERRCYPFPWTPGIFRDCLRVGYSCWVLEQETQIRGYALMSFGAGEAHLLNVCVDPFHQSQGLGRGLVEHVIRQARRLGNDRLFLEVRPSNEAAKRLYERLGFSLIGRRKDYYPAEQGREDAHVYSLEL